MTGDDQLATLRELLRDALEIVRSTAAAPSDPDAASVFERANDNIVAALVALDDYATRRGRSTAS